MAKKRQKPQTTRPSVPAEDGPTKQVLQPVVELTPQACRMVRLALDTGIAAFGNWNIKPRAGSWIQNVASWLDHVIASNSLGTTDEELRRTSAAVALAVDLYHVGTCLGDEANSQVGAELSNICGGRLLGRGDSAAGKDALAQFWVGALLAQSRLKPSVMGYDPGKGAAKPDYIIIKGGVRFSVEVKRPRTRESASRAVLAASSQVRKFDGPGIIIVDATECMSVDPWAVHKSTSTARKQMGVDLGSLHRDLVHLASSYRRSGKFRQLSMLLTFARFWNWTADESGAIRRDAGILFHGYGFPYLWSRQVTSLTREIQESLLGGVEQLTGNPPTYEWS
jgi:hypothetical protein